MMKPLIFTLFNRGELIDNICNKSHLEIVSINYHEFPNGESYIQINANLENTTCIIFDTLIDPNKKILPLIFLAETIKDLGARNVGFIAPYLAYMRQDKQFLPGEGITSRYFAKLISHYFDWMITIGTDIQFGSR